MRIGKFSGLDLTNAVGYSKVLGSLPGSVFVLPYYGSGIDSDTVITVTSGGSTKMHLFFIHADGTLAQNVYVTGSGTVYASIVDSGHTGIILGVASNAGGKAISANVFSASAYVTMPNYAGVEYAHLFKFLNPETVGGITALAFDGLTFLEPFHGSVGLIDVYNDSFVSLANIEGILATGLAGLDVSLRIFGRGPAANAFISNPKACQISGVLSSVYPDSTVLANVLPDPLGQVIPNGGKGNLWANCPFGMVLNKIGKDIATVVDGGDRVTGSFTIPVIP